MAKSMKLHMTTTVTFLHDFDAAILQPLRIQMMGSVVVNIKCMDTLNMVIVYITLLFGLTYNSEDHTHDQLVHTKDSKLHFFGSLHILDGSDVQKPIPGNSC